MNFDEMVAREAAQTAEVAADTIRRGQMAGRELVLIEEFVTSRIADLTRAMLDCDPTNTAALQVILIGLRVVRDLHNTLTAAVAAGLTAAQRLHEQATKGDAP